MTSRHAARGSGIRPRKAVEMRFLYFQLPPMVMALSALHLYASRAAG